jgi:hypothetical protein
MPHTPEQRTLQPLCNARKKNGETCRAFAGQGTDHPGVGKCKFHGGSTRSHRTHAVIEQAKIRAARLGEPYEMEPTEALVWSVHMSAGQVRYLGEELSTLEVERTNGESLILQRLWNEERDRLARISKAALDAGVQERAIVLAERTGAAIADVLRGVFSDPELRLTRAQRDRLPDLLRRHLMAVERRPPEIGAGIRREARTYGPARACRGPRERG